MLQTNKSAVRSFLLIIVVLCVFSAVNGTTPLPCITADITSEHQKFILSGVETILLTSIAGTISLLNENSFPILAGWSDGILRPHVAATEFRAGRIVAFSHTNSLIDENISDEYDNHQLLINSIDWVGRNSVRKIGLYPDWKLRKNVLSVHGFHTQLISETNLNNYTYLQQFDVLIIHNLTPDADVVGLRTYIANGGGMIVAATPWSNYNPYGMKSFWGNILLRDTGLYYIGSHLTYGNINCNGVVGGCFNASMEHLRDTHAYHVWNDFKQYTWNQTHLARNKIHQIMQIIDDRLRYGPSDDILNREIHLVLSQVPTFVPTEVAPVTLEYQKVFLIIHRYLCDFLNIVGLASYIPAHPSAESFPGNEIYLKYERVSHVIMVNATHPSEESDSENSTSNRMKIPDGSTDYSVVEETLKIIQIISTRTAWHSTGLYARPGEEIIIQVLTEDETDLNLEVQIGAHSDNIEHQPIWKRCPHIVFRNRIERNPTTIANPFGGLIYINLNGYRKNLLQLSILGGIVSPSYFMGNTILSRWRNEIRNNPAPWGELVGDNLIIIAKRSFMLQLNDPEAIIDFWHRVSDAMSDLAAIPREKNRADRFVTDVQISVGDMHAGYPIMYDIHLEDIPLNISVARQHPQRLWGFFHELGHNHQKSDWTFSFAVEVTCNLFTLYVMNTVLFIPTNETHAQLSDYDVERLLSQYIENGRQFSEWMSDPFLALITYVQLQEAYGWSSYRRVFANYGQLAEDERPHTDQEKIDLWMKMFSRVVEENLASFFISWGFPISSEAVAHISHLPSTTLRIDSGLESFGKFNV